MIERSLGHKFGLELVLLPTTPRQIGRFVVKPPIYIYIWGLWKALLIDGTGRKKIPSDYTSFYLREVSSAKC